MSVLGPTAPMLRRPRNGDDAAWGWATVTSVNPMMIQLPGLGDPVPAASLTIGLVVGDRVYYRLKPGTRPVTWGQSAPPFAKSVPSLAGANAWLAQLVAEGVDPAIDPVWVWRSDTGTLERNSGSSWVVCVPAAPAWATYTPTLGGFTGTVNRAQWVDVGGLVVVQVTVTVATVTGTMRVSLPVTAAASAVDLTAPAGVATAHGLSTIMQPAFIASTTQIGMRSTDTGEWNASRPIAWAAGNIYAVQVAYRRA